MIVHETDLNSRVTAGKLLLSSNIYAMRSEVVEGTRRINLSRLALSKAQIEGRNRAKKVGKEERDFGHHVNETRTRERCR